MVTGRKVIYRKALPSDYPGILELQAANLLANLQESEKEDGFLSIEFDEKQFEEMNADLAVIAAVAGDEVVGYLCAASCEYGVRFRILEALIGKFEGLNINGKELTPGNSFIYGPVCVAKSFRGMGVLQGLFGKLKDIAGTRYTFCVSFVSDRNKRSLNAHTKKLGMLDLGLFTVKDNTYHILGARIV